MIQLVSSGSGAIISLAEAKQQVRANTNDDDDFISSLIHEAQAFIEADTGLRFYGDVYKETYPYFSQAYQLLRYPVSAVSTIKYYNSANVLTTLPASAYEVEKPTYSQCFVRILGNTPTAYDRLDAIEINYTTGVVPPLLAKRAAKLLVETWYSNRSGEVQYGVPTEIHFGVSNLLRRIDKRGYF